jgi:hypothetical protein
LDWILDKSNKWTREKNKDFPRITKFVDHIQIVDELTRINNAKGTANAQINALSCDNQQLNEKSD